MLIQQLLQVEICASELTKINACEVTQFQLRDWAQVFEGLTLMKNEI